MAFWQPTQYKNKKINRQFGDGVNTFVQPFDIGESELTDSLNMCADDYPAIRTRNDRTLTTLPALTNPKALGQRNNEYIHVLDNNTWKYGTPNSTAWTVVSTSMSTGTGKFVEFNTQATRYTILANANSSGAQIYAYDGSTTLVSLTTNAPRSNLFTAHKFRLYGIDANGRTLKHSAQGNITDWITSLDAGAIDLTNAKGAATALVTYQDHVIVFTGNSMHELYGTEPLNFTLVDVSNDVGCVNDRTVIECRGKLYWLDYNGVYLYTGGIPQLVSDKVKKYIDGIDWTYKSLCSAGAKDDKVYVAIPYKSTSINTLLVYDTYKNKWFVEDGNNLQFVNINDVLYGQKSDGTIWNMNSTNKTGYDSTSHINWSFETKAYNDFEIDVEVGVKDIWLIHSGTTSATLDVAYTTNIDSTSYTTLINSTELTHNTEPVKEQYMVPMNQLQGINWHKYKLSGTGHKKISGMQINAITYGGE